MFAYDLLFLFVCLFLLCGQAHLLHECSLLGQLEMDEYADRAIKALREHSDHPVLIYGHPFLLHSLTSSVYPNT